MVSLFPAEVSVERPFRPDLLALLKQMKPAFVRFPGGCHVEGSRFQFAYRWKPTIGDPAARGGWWKKGGYYNGNGMGLHEYLLLCEELGAEPIYVLNCGMGDGWVGTPEEVKELVQDALDAIEYMIGPVESVWGKRRAEAGHPAPFHLKTVEIGNENGGPAYAERFPIFRDAIRARYPQLELIQDDVVEKTGSIIDHHFYTSPERFLQRSTMYDHWDRNGNKVMVGEYAAAVRLLGRLGDLRAALAEAAFMTGMERNSDVVLMACFAPLAGHVGWLNWGQFGILVDAAQVVATPSWHVQTLFGQNRGDQLLPLEIEGPMMLAQEPFEGRLGFGTDHAQAEFKDLRVTCGAEVLYAPDFPDANAIGLQSEKGWKPKTGSWKIEQSALHQDSLEKSTQVILGGFGQNAWAGYTLSAKLRKLGGPGGLRIYFGQSGGNERTWWQLGGANNNVHLLSLQNAQYPPVKGNLENGRWYDIRIEMPGERIRCYLDNQLVHDVPAPELNTLYAVASRNRSTQEIILKVVNMAPTPVKTALQIRGVGKLSPTGQVVTLSSENFADTNSTEAPDKVAPRESTFPVSGPQFSYTIPARAVTVLRIHEITKR